MKMGTDDRNKLIAAGSLGAVALGFVAYTFLGGPSGSETTTTAPPPVVTTSTTPVATARVAPVSNDPSLHPEGMLLAESFVYTGRGRNLFSAVNDLPPAPVAIKTPPLQPLPQPVQGPIYAGPPPPPPINLRFFGTVTDHNGTRRAFLLQGEDVFLAATGDVVARKYRIGEITATVIDVTDLTNNNHQRLPYSAQ